LSPAVSACDIRVTMIGLNPLLVDTGTPPIPEAQAWLRDYGGGRGPAIDLSQAVPGYPAHPEMLARLGEAASTSAAAAYGPILGDEALREAYAAHAGALYGAGIRAAEVALTAGCNLAFVVAMMALARSGDAVLLPSPWYFNHQMTLRMLGIEARPLPCAPDAGFVPDPEEAARLLDARVRAIVLVTPNNPTGAVYPPATVEAFATLCRKRGIRLVVDETYRDFLADASQPPHDLFRGDWRGHVLQLYSFSKSYCIPGHRAGAIVADDTILAEIAKALDCLQICAPRPAPLVLPWAIPALAGWRETNRMEIAARAAAFVAAFTKLPDWRIDSIGAYFAYVRHPGAGAAAARVAEALATQRGVLALPGPYFGPGQDGHLRIAFANAGIDRIGLLAERLA
jgi:aspartate/methionine/tyrosine aminotransferase